MKTNKLKKSKNEIYLKQYIQNIDLSNQSFQQEIIKECTFLNTSFYDVQLSEAQFQVCHFEHCTFSESMVYKTIFQDCLFKNCDLRKWDILNTVFINCIFNECNFRVADFTSAKIEGILIRNSINIPDILKEYENT
jgi:uncharacterized protein YjbI with pentapeptide repeats